MNNAMIKRFQELEIENAKLKERVALLEEEVMYPYLGIFSTDIYLSEYLNWDSKYYALNDKEFLEEIGIDFEKQQLFITKAYKQWKERLKENERRKKEYLSKVASNH